MAKTPEINADTLNRELGGVLQRVDIEGIRSQAQEAISQFQALKNTTLATEANRIAAGFQSLTEELDDIEGLDEADRVAQRGVALLQENAGSLQVVNDPAGSNSDLETLTEGGVGGGQLNFKVTAPTPEAISRALAEVTGEPLENVSRELGAISNSPLGDIQTAVNDVVGKNLNIGQNFLNQVSTFTSGLEAEIGNLKNGFTGQIKNLSENLNGQLSPALNRITAGNAPVVAQLRPQVAQLLETNNVARAAELLNERSPLDLTEIENRLSDIPVTVSEKVARDIPLPSKGTVSRLIGG